MFTGTKPAAVLGAAALTIGLAAAPAAAGTHTAARGMDCSSKIHSYKHAAKALVTECAEGGPDGTAFSASVKVSDTKTDGKCAYAAVWVVGHSHRSRVTVHDCTKNGKASATKRTGWWAGSDVKYLVWAS